MATIGAWSALLFRMNAGGNPFVDPQGYKSPPNALFQAQWQRERDGRIERFQ